MVNMHRAVRPSGPLPVVMIELGSLKSIRMPLDILLPQLLPGTALFFQGFIHFREKGDQCLVPWLVFMSRIGLKEQLQCGIAHAQDLFQRFVHGNKFPDKPLDCVAAHSGFLADHGLAYTLGVCL